MHLSNAIRQFIAYLTFEKRYSPHTILAYQTDLEQFAQFLKGNFEVELINEVSTPFVRTWLAGLKDEKLAARSLNRKISALKSFYKYLLRQGLAENSPLATLSGPKNPGRLPVYIEQPQLDTLWQSNIFPDTWDGLTAQLVLKTLYEMGLRRSELVNLKVGQIDFSQRTIRVTGKGNKERILPASHELLELFRNYLSQREAIAAIPTKQVLVHEDGRPVQPQWVYQTVKTYLSAVTTQDKKSPHVLRHSFATHLTNNGADLNAVKELLGHSSLAATQVYTHNSIDKLKKVHGLAHPRG